MAGRWYYAQGDCKIGPFSAAQLKDLADVGTILSSDTIWKEGIEKSVLASRVKNLFTFAPPIAPPAKVHPSGGVAVPHAEKANAGTVPAIGDRPGALGARDALTTPQPAAAVPPVQAKSPQEPPKRGRAVALKGAEIVSQDGVQAKYRKKCIECKQKDSSTQMVTLTNKTVRASYFCPKCRKRREVAIQCFSK